MPRGNFEVMGTRLTLDESRVRQALYDYLLVAYDPEDVPDAGWFTAVVTLYDRYCDFMARNEPNGHVLPPSQFGRTLGRVKGVDRSQKRRHWVVRNGRRIQEWGYLWLKGPGSVPVPIPRGSRLAKASDKAATAAPEVQSGSEADPG